jgi:hypothetical protein
MAKPTKEQNKANLNQMCLLITAIVMGDDEEDIELCSRSLAYFDKDLAAKYWELSNALPKMFKIEMQRAMKEKKG